MALMPCPPHPPQRAPLIVDSPKRSICIEIPISVMVAPLGWSCLLILILFAADQTWKLSLLMIPSPTPMKNPEQTWKLSYLDNSFPHEEPYRMVTTMRKYNKNQKNQKNGILTNCEVNYSESKGRTIKGFSRFASTTLEEEDYPVLPGEKTAEVAPAVALTTPRWKQPVYPLEGIGDQSASPKPQEPVNGSARRVAVEIGKPPVVCLPRPHPGLYQKTAPAKRVSIKSKAYRDYAMSQKLRARIAAVHCKRSSDPQQDAVGRSQKLRAKSAAIHCKRPSCLQQDAVGRSQKLQAKSAAHHFKRSSRPQRDAVRRLHGRKPFSKTARPFRPKIGECASKAFRAKTSKYVTTNQSVSQQNGKFRHVPEVTGWDAIENSTPNCPPPLQYVAPDHVVSACPKYQARPPNIAQVRKLSRSTSCNESNGSSVEKDSKKSTKCQERDAQYDHDAQSRVPLAEKLPAPEKQTRVFNQLDVLGNRSSNCPMPNNGHKFKLNWIGTSQVKSFTIPFHMFTVCCTNHPENPKERLKCKAEHKSVKWKMHKHHQRPSTNLHLSLYSVFQEGLPIYQRQQLRYPRVFSNNASVGWTPLFLHSDRSVSCQHVLHGNQNKDHQQFEGPRELSQQLSSIRGNQSQQEQQVGCTFEVGVNRSPNQAKHGAFMVGVKLKASQSGQAQSTYGGS